MHRSSMKIRIAQAAAAQPSPASQQAASQKGARHRASEPWKPKPNDLCADRLDALELVVSLQPHVAAQLGDLDAPRIAKLVDEQRALETKLHDAFATARATYERYHACAKPARDALLNALTRLSPTVAKCEDTTARDAFRLARRRNPSAKEIARLRDKAKKGGAR